MNCIDCENLILWGKDEKNREFFTQCERANPQIRKCEWFKNAKRKVTEVKNETNNMR